MPDKRSYRQLVWLLGARCLGPGVNEQRCSYPLIVRPLVGLVGVHVIGFLFFSDFLDISIHWPFFISQQTQIFVILPG